MNTVLWITAGVLAAIYAGVGLVKLLVPPSRLAARPNMAFVQEVPPVAIKALGLIEVLGAIGLIVPQATGIAQRLTPAAAIGLALVQVGAIIFHVRRREYRELPVNIVLLLAAALVAIGRS